MYTHHTILRCFLSTSYFAQDEIGTPSCVTVDFDTLEDDTVTVRDRDTAKQERVKIDNLTSALTNLPTPGLST